MFLIGVRGLTADAVCRWRCVVRVDFAHILIPLVLHDAPDLRESRQREVRLIGATHFRHTFGDANQRIGHAVNILFALHGAEFGDVLFHEPHLLIDAFKLLFVEFHHVFGIDFRPTDQHRVGVFE